MTATHRFLSFSLSLIFVFFIYFFCDFFFVFGFCVDFLANAFILCTCICTYVSVSGGYVAEAEAALYSGSDRLIDRVQISRSKIYLWFAIRNLHGQTDRQTDRPTGVVMLLWWNFVGNSSSFRCGSSWNALRYAAATLPHRCRLFSIRPPLC